MRLTTDEGAGAAWGAAHRALPGGLEALANGRLLGVHGVDGAGRYHGRFAESRGSRFLRGRWRLRGKGPHGNRRRELLLRGEGQRMALGGRRTPGRLELHGRPGLARKGARRQAPLAIGRGQHHLLGFAGYGGGDFDHTLPLEEKERNNL